MKTKTYLRYISCVLAVLLCVASIMPIAFADSTNHGNSESLFDRIKLFCFVLDEWKRCC